MGRKNGIFYLILDIHNEYGVYFINGFEGALIEIERTKDFFVDLMKESEFVKCFYFIGSIFVIIYCIIKVMYLIF